MGSSMLLKCREKQMNIAKCLKLYFSMFTECAEGLKHKHECILTNKIKLTRTNTKYVGVLRNKSRFIKESLCLHVTPDLAEMGFCMYKAFSSVSQCSFQVLC